jgi:hypothetical protein
VSGRRRATIAAPRSTGDLRKRARLMQFPRVDVSAGGLDVEVAEQCGTDVDRKAVLDEVGGEQATCLRRSRVQLGSCCVWTGKVSGCGDCDADAACVAITPG